MSELLITQCPFCQTRFRLSQEQLQAAAGNVRCGACLRVFNARPTPISDPASDDHPASPSTAPSEQQSLLIHDDMSYEDMDLEALGLDESILEEINPSETSASRDEQRTPDPIVDTPQNTEPEPTAEPEPEPAPEPEPEPEPEPKLELRLEDIDNWPDLNATEDDEDDDFWASLDAELASDHETTPELTENLPPDETVSAGEPTLENDEPILDLHEDFIATSPARDFGPAAEPTVSLSDEDGPDATRDLDAPVGPLRPLADDDADHGVFLRDRVPARQRTLPFASEGSAGADRRREPGIGSLYDLPDLHDEPLYLDEEDQRPRRKRRTGIWLLLSILAAAGLGAQYVYYNFDALTRDRVARPWLESVCLLAGCELPAKVDVSQLRSSNLLVRPHPEFPNALAIDAMLYNRADYAQPFPVLLMQFTDTQGREVASRRFRPDEYLSGELAGAELMPPQVPIRVALSMLDPGPEAASYTLDFESR